MMGVAEGSILGEFFSVSLQSLFLTPCEEQPINVEETGEMRMPMEPRVQAWVELNV